MRQVGESDSFARNEGSWPFSIEIERAPEGLV